MSVKKGKIRSKENNEDGLPGLPPTTAPPPSSPGSGLEASPRLQSQIGDTVVSAPSALGRDSTKPKRVTSNKRHNPNDHHHGGRGDADAFTFPTREPITNLWQQCCDEVAAEVTEANTFLAQMGIPPVTYRRDKHYPKTDYEAPEAEIPDLEASRSKDFLDYYVFPVLLPAIQSLIEYVKTNRVLQCRYCAFNPLDYIVEYLYNNNPLAPERKGNPKPIFEIEFVKSWLELYPRPAMPNWMIMTDDQAARILQRAVRGFLARIRPDVQEMRQFWKDYKKDMEEENNRTSGDLPTSAQLMSPYYDEIAGEWSSEDLPRRSSVFLTHSDTCEFCQRLKVFLQYQQELMKEMMSYTEDGGEDSDVPVPPPTVQTPKNKINKAVSTMGVAKKLKDASSRHGKSHQPTAGNLLGIPEPKQGKKSVSKAGKKSPKPSNASNKPNKA